MIFLLFIHAPFHHFAFLFVFSPSPSSSHLSLLIPQVDILLYERLFSSPSPFSLFTGSVRVAEGFTLPKTARAAVYAKIGENKIEIRDVPGICP